jgi:hypothetical protein
MARHRQSNNDRVQIIHAEGDVRPIGGATSQPIIFNDTDH